MSCFAKDASRASPRPLCAGVDTVDSHPTKIKVAAVVAYDGTNYFGFQYQTNRPTIQGTLEEGLAKVVQSPCRVTGSGRTDTGVHASGQVVSALVPWRHTSAALLRAWNAHLPPDIVVRHLCQVPDEFHPRFSARSRTYLYTVYQSETDQERNLVRRSPLTDRFALLQQGHLDVAKMHRAGQHLVGEHDFITFGRPPQGNNSVRTVQELRIQEYVAPFYINGLGGKHIVFTITANAFLRQMVRNVVGTLIEVGRNRWKPEDVLQALQARDRSRCAPPAPPAGLVLQHVGYPEYPDLFTYSSKTAAEHCDNQTS